MSTQLRPLGLIKEVIEDAGMSISYFYEDLVFIDQNLYLLQFDDNKINSAFLYFNKNLLKEAAEELKENLLKSAKSKQFSVVPKGQFDVEQKEGEEVEIKFFDK